MPPKAAAETAERLDDGFQGAIDWEWAHYLARLLQDAPLFDSLEDALRPLDGQRVFHNGTNYVVNANQVGCVAAGKREQWVRTNFLAKHGLPSEFMEFALAIHVYSLEVPYPIYRVVNESMWCPERWDRRTQQPSGALQNALPFARHLAEALVRLPERFHFAGDVWRGVKWVYPDRANHNPQGHFQRGADLLWYEFKSCSRRRATMQPLFCGSGPGPRTIFAARVTHGYKIEAFSGAPNEQEVLVAPLAKFRVSGAERNVRDAAGRADGDPDMVRLEQVGQVSWYTREVQEPRRHLPALKLEAASLRGQLAQLQTETAHLREQVAAAPPVPTAEHDSADLRAQAVACLGAVRSLLGWHDSAAQPDSAIERENAELRDEVQRARREIDDLRLQLDSAARWWEQCVVLLLLAAATCVLVSKGPKGVWRQLSRPGLSPL